MGKSFRATFSASTFKHNQNGVPHEPLQGEDVYGNDDNVTPFSKAGILSRITFWWMNPLMKMGKQKVLENDDIPKLRLKDQAKTCYLEFMDQLNKKEKGWGSPDASILYTILSWQMKPVLISGIFALLKVLMLSTGPLFLNAFIEVVEGKAAFKYEGYALTAMLFLAKCLESFSERQLNFRTRLIGLQVRSTLTAAIYQKQLKLSSAAKVKHSPGKIVNYAAVDAHRIGEFPFWLHQIWTVCLQMCLALLIIYYCVGIATTAAILVIALTMLGKSPLGKLLHKAGQKVEGMTEALGTMRVLKLYAWEMHAKKVIEKLREKEFKWLSAVILLKGYYIILFWWFPTLMSVSIFWACYLLGISLDAGNVFTFLATMRIIQEPVRSFPDVACAYVEASISLHRIIKFLEAPELENQQGLQSERKTNMMENCISIKNATVSWDSHYCMKPTLRNFNLAVKPGERVAICGEVGAGKSTVLAAILGEVPHLDGTMSLLV
ncbi:hypothetical protein Dimus_013436 [Dionaea muscipula]